MRQTTGTLRLRDMEENEEKREELDPFEQLQRDLGRTEAAPRQMAEVRQAAKAEETTDPFEQLQRDLGRTGAPETEDSAPARIIDRTEAGVDWGQKGRFRPSGATEGYTAARWATDDPAELERQIEDLSGQMRRTGAGMRVSSAPIAKLQPLREKAASDLNGMESRLTGMESTLTDMDGKLQTARGNVDAMGKKLESLSATMNDETASSRDRLNAQMTMRALYPKYEREADRYNALLRERNALEGRYSDLAGQYDQALAQFRPLETVYQQGVSTLRRQAGEYEAARRELGNTWKQYTAVSSTGDEEAARLLEEAEGWRKKADEAFRHGQATAEFLRKAEKAEEQAAQARQRYAGYLSATQGEEAAQAYLNGEDPLTRKRNENLSWGQKILNTVGGTALNLFSGYAGSPLITLAQIMEMPDAILYDITKNERFNPDRFGMRTSKALEASDPFRTEAQRLGENAGWLGKQIVGTGYAAGSMLSAHGIAGAALGAMNTAPLTGALEGIANSSPLLTSRAARFGANLGLNAIRDVVGNPGNAGVSFGAGVRGFTEAMEKGDNFGQALSIGIEKAALEYFSNKLFSGTPLEDSPEGKGYVTELVEWLAEKLGKSEALESFNRSMGGKVINWLFDKGGEGLEEVVSAIGEPLVEWANENDILGSLLRGEKPKGPDWPKFDEIADEFIGGVLLSLLMTGGEETVKALNRTATTAQARQAVIRDLEAKGIDRKAAAQYAPAIVKAIFAAQKAEDAVREAAEKAGPEARSAAENTAPVITAGREAARDAGQMPGAQTANRGTENPPIDAGARATESETGAGGQAETQPGTEARTGAPAAPQGNAVESTAPVITAAEPLTQAQEEARLNARGAAPVITAGTESTNAQAAQDTAPVITAGQNEQGVQNGQRTEAAGAPADGQGTELPGRNGGRDAGERTGEQAEGLGKGAKNWRTLPQAQKAAERQNRGKRIRAEKVSGQDLGIHGATAEKAVIIYPESAWDEELQAIDRVTVKETGQHATFILGSIPVPGTASGKVRGVNAGGRIIVQVDSLGVSATQLFAHEMFHEWARNDPQLVERVKQKITDTYSREEFDAIVDKYLEKKAGAMDLSMLDEAAMQRLVDKCTEEVCADAYAGINAFGQKAGKYVQEARAAVKEAGTARETEAATERRTGPPEERYSEAERDEEYMAAVEAGDMETAQRLVDEAAKAAGYDYVRRTRRKLNPRNNDADYYLFVERDRSDATFAYGDNQYVASGDGASEASEMLPEIRDAWAKFAEEYGYPAQIWDEEIDPDDIIMSAGVWDNREFVTWLADRGTLPDAIKTQDGLIVFGDDYARIKSADPVTYDDQGNVIPLSERFNPEEEDIRFSEDEEPEYTAEDLPALKAEYREISDLAHRSRLKELDRDKWMENEARRKELRRIIARLGTVDPSLNAARADMERRESMEYQQELLAQGGIKALRENEKKIKELRKKIGKLEKIAGTAEGTGDPSSVGFADTFPQGKAETEIPQSAAEYARRKEAGTLPEAERIRELEQEIAARKDPARQAQLLYEKGAEAVAREVREVQKLQAELRELRRPKLPTAQRAQTDNESIPQSAAEYARRKAEGTLPRSLSEETRARIEEIKRDLKERDTREHKDAIYREKGAEALAAEVNAIKRLKGELNRLEQGDRVKAVPTKTQITWAKRDLADTLMNTFSTPNHERKSMRSIIESAADRMLRNGDLSYQEEAELFNRLWDAGEVVWQGEEGQEVKHFLRNTRIYTPAEVKEEFGDHWNEFRKRAFSFGVYLTNDTNDQGWDSVNTELADAFPGLFDAQELDPRTVLERIVQLAEEGRGEKLTLGEYAAKVAGVEWVSQDELEDTLRRKLSWALQTFAKQAKVEKYYKDKMGERITQEREAAAQRLDEAVAKERQREKQREAIRRGKEKEARRAAEQRKKELAVLKETQQKTLRQLQWLSRNQNKFPEEARARAKEILEDIDIYAISAADEMHIDNATGRTWRDLADTYKEAREKDPNWMPSADLERIVARLDNKKIGQMDIDALRTLYQAAVQLRTELYNRNNLINDMLHREFSEVYSQVKQELENAPEPKTGAAQKYADWQLTPMNRFLQMAGWDKESQWYQMGQMLEQGEREERRFKTRAQNMVGQFLRDNQDWVRRADGQGKDAIWYEIEVPELLELGMGDKPIFGGSKKVWMTPAQKVELYLESKGYDNLRHMTGGRTFPDKELYSKGERKAALEKGTTIRLAPESVKNIVKDLTPEEMALANLLEQFYNNFSKAEINRVSNLLYGYDKAMEAYYAPIFTNDNYTKSEPGVFDLTAEGVGNLKERQVSSVPSLNLSAFDAFERSVDKTAKFVGLAIPIRNMNTLWNWTGEKTSTKEIVSQKWPVQGKNFIEDLMTELQNGRNAQNGKLDELVNQALNKYISSVFGANASVVVKQFGSYPLAASYLGWKNLTMRPRKAAQVDTDLISAYTGELDYRMLGYATPETAALKNNPGILQRRGPLNFLFGGGAITWMDGFTVRTLWTAAENKVSREQPDLERGTEEQIRSGQSEYYQAVAKEFEEAVSRSQPMYDTMHRSDIMRKQGALTRAFTLFKTVPQQEFNMLMESYGEVQAALRSGDAERIKAAKGKMGRTVSGIIVGNLGIGIITFLNAMWKNRGKKYRDEEGNLNVGSIMEQFGKQFFADTLGLGLFGDLAADQIAAVFWDDKLYDIDSPGLEQVNDIYQRTTAAAKKAWTLAKDSVDVLIHGGNWLKYLNMHGDEYVSAVEDVARMLGTYGAGLPMDNVKGYLLGAMRWASPKIATAYEDIMSKADRSGLKGLTGGALELRMEHILRDRIGSAEEETVYTLSRLYEAGIRDAAPPDMPAKVTVDGEERKLNLVQEQTYASAYQMTVGRSLNELVRSKGFRAADAEARGKMLKALYDYGREEAKAAVWPDYEPETEKAESFMEAGMTLAQWAEYKVETAGRKKEDILDYIDGMDLTRDEKDAVYYAQGYAESKIDETPWHRGGRRGSGNTWAKADQSWLMLPAMPQASRSSGPVLPEA